MDSKFAPRFFYSRRLRLQGPAAAGGLAPRAGAAAMAPAVAEAEPAADLGRQVGISPATPDIVRKPTRASGTPAADGSCCTALYTSAAAGPRKVDSECLASVPSHAHEHSQSAMPEDLGQVGCDPVGTQESSTLPPLVGESSGNLAQQEQQQHQEEGVASGSDAGAASPPILLFRRRSNSARRKLDLDSSESKTCFSRAELMGNLMSLAKIHGLNSEPTTRKRSKRGKKRKLMVGHKESGQLAFLPYQRTPTVAASFALEPLWYSTELDIPRPQNHGKLQAKVLGLTDETLRVFAVLTEWDRSDSESFEGFDIGSGPEWDTARRTFEHYVDIFIAEMFALIGPRKHSQWGGSLIDSVVGTFLTHNSADNLSSQAFMNLAAKFSPRKRHYKANATPLVDGDDKNVNSNEALDMFDFVDSHFDGYVDSEEEVDYDTEVKGHYGEDEDYNRLIGNFAASMKQKNISTWDSDLMNLVKDKSGNPVCTEKNLKRILASLQQQPDTASNWKELWEEAYKKGYNDKSRTETSDVVDWESVLNAPFSEEFLDHVQKAQDGSFDLDWLRFISPEKAKKILLSIHGFGVKSVDCLCLLSLRHRAFPVDVNVARIVTRLGWVKLQPLNGADFHLINLYLLLDDVQRYLWPRLCTIDKEKLYELHCLMITFGKVVCTKQNPNCRACPFSASCIYYNSLLARKPLPLPEKHEHEQGEQQASMVVSGSCTPSSQQMYQYQIPISSTTETPPIHNCEPIIEMPPSPEYEYNRTPNEQEDSYEDYYACDIEDFAPEGVQYVLPDDHLILEEFEDRVPEDKCPYLLVVLSCPDDYTVEGTVLIPCRTANRGKFPLNGTYFQENEVFADYSSSRNPITIPRECIGMLKRSVVYSITKGQTREDIQECFKEGVKWL
ncbi:unnamed protein product [Miscanthus lutarioriparius]|uniref:Demeter RRM-fold domain-containing protein n=1 Tax=Miscanthus lutarioriparius TaxID=422564 RepID=A0A811QUH8_9POAL|nr:unnamed protein product [Miscanthus lutarioriparius]